jgi:uncharacterized protein
MLDYSRWRSLFIAVPWLLIITTYLVFRALLSFLPLAHSLFIGYLFYWGFWCLIVPFTLVRPVGMRAMFRPPEDGRVGQPAWLGWTLLAIPVALSALVIFPQMLPALTIPVIFFSVLFALANGVFGEILWRGTYMIAFQRSYGLGYFYPALMFGLWHLSPYFAVYGRIDLPAVLAVVGGIIFGLCWGWVAIRTGSIRWTIASHVVAGIFWMAVAVFFGYDPLG